MSHPLFIRTPSNDSSPRGPGAPQFRHSIWTARSAFAADGLEADCDWGPSRSARRFFADDSPSPKDPRWSERSTPPHTPPALHTPTLHTPSNTTACVPCVPGAAYNVRALPEPLDICDHWSTLELPAGGDGDTGASPNSMQAATPFNSPTHTLSPRGDGGLSDDSGADVGDWSDCDPEES